MFTIGITGPTGAGKTTALRALEEMGGQVIDCDAVYHRLLETDGALTVEALGLAYALLETLGKGFCEAAAIRPAACFDKNICALRLSGIGRFVLAQNILEYLKGKHAHAKR